MNIKIRHDVSHVGRYLSLMRRLFLYMLLLLQQVIKSEKMLKWAKSRRKRKSPNSKCDDFSSISSLIARNLTLRAAPPRKIPRNFFPQNFSLNVFALSTSENELQPKDQITPLSYFQEDESTRAWGDELSGDLLYTIILRRVRYSKNSDEGLQWETQKVKLYYVKSVLVTFSAN